jgi:(2Fe-2S) ferredoxin
MKKGCFFASPIAKMKYDVHIFVCANQKPEGKKCCGEEFGMKAVQTLRQCVKQANLPAKIRVQKAGCLDVCQQGPALVIYPEGVFYGNLNEEMLPEIVEKHIARKEILENHLLPEE